MTLTKFMNPGWVQEGGTWKEAVKHSPLDWEPCLAGARSKVDLRASGLPAYRVPLLFLNHLPSPSFSTQFGKKGKASFSFGIQGLWVKVSPL